jgi:pimeloyl-ACP methyl ester carboxylesterase
MAPQAETPMTLHALEDGQTCEPPLLLVHGFLTSHRHWDNNLGMRQHFRLIRVDLPAHGGSTAPHTARESEPDELSLQPRQWAWSI